MMDCIFHLEPVQTLSPLADWLAYFITRLLRQVPTSFFVGPSPATPQGAEVQDSIELTEPQAPGAVPESPVG